MQTTGSILAACLILAFGCGSVQTRSGELEVLEQLVASYEKSTDERSRDDLVPKIADSFHDLDSASPPREVPRPPADQVPEFLLEFLQEEAERAAMFEARLDYGSIRYYESGHFLYVAEAWFNQKYVLVTHNSRSRQSSRKVQWRGESLGPYLFYVGDEPKVWLFP